MTMQLIETIEVGAGGAASIEFTSIPQDGVDLLLVVSARSSDTSPFVCLATLNSDSGSNYSYVEINGNGSSVSSASGTLAYFRLTIVPSSYTANTFSNNQLYISNYTSSVDKSASIEGVNENNSSLARQYLFANKYATTSPITSIELQPLSPDLFVQYSTASLYKIS